MPEVLTYAYYLNLVLVSVTMFLVVHFYNSVAASKFQELEGEKRKTDDLMRSMLPDYVANRIMEQGAVVADWHQEATVLIITVSGFDALSKKITAVHLVEILSQIFVRFDELVKKHGVEKINTLDTTYVIATGIDKDRAPDHNAIASTALEALELVKELSAELGHPFAFCAGISTGQVVSGVIGDARPSFDIWGDTVELANSMRSSALDNSIVVNEPAYWRLKPDFEFAALEGSPGNYLLLQANASPSA
jgi:guanylate cyclase